MKIAAIIPARLGSTRFPGKPLTLIAGRPMIEHVYWRTRLCDSLDDVVVATCDDAIAAAVERFGGHAVMTSSAHERASDRVAEAAQGLTADLIVMVQGDEPLIVPEMIDAAIEPLAREPAVGCVNLVAPIRSARELQDWNTIKVVQSARGDALYFSRAVIPARRSSPGELPSHPRYYKQVCVIPFRRDLLLRYATLPPTPLEQAESIDMLRLLEHGYRVRLVETDRFSQAVDVPDDVPSVEAMLANDPLIARYRQAAAAQ